MSESQGSSATRRERLGAQVVRFVPIASWARIYDRGLWSGDLISGLTLGAVMIPVALAYAQMAGVPPQAGLYSALAGMTAYAIFGSSRHVRVTTSSTMAVMSAAVVAPMAAGDAAAYAVLSSALALVVGVILVVAGIVHLGFISDFLSKSVVTGFVFGLAITIVISQLPKIFGVPAGSGNSFEQLYQLLLNLDELHPITLVLGAGALVAVIVIKRFYPKIPASLVVLAAGITIVAILNLDEQGVSVVGEIPKGLPSLQFPNAGTGNWSFLITGAMGIVFLAVGESLGAARAYAARYRTEVDPDQELIALGASNISTGMLQGFAVDVSLSQTATADAAGGRSQFSSLVSAGVVLVTILFLSGIFKNLPNSVLAAIVIASVIGLMDVDEMRRFYEGRPTDFALAGIALFGVVATDVLTGLMIAVLLSLLALLYRASRPYIAILGQEMKDPGVFGDIKRHRRYQSIPGLLMMRLDAPLYFLNANVARSQIEAAVSEETPRVVLLDVGASADLDIASSDMLQELTASLREQGTDLYLAQVRGSVRDRLRRTGVTKVIGEDHIFQTVQRAVLAFHEAQAQNAPR